MTQDVRDLIAEVAADLDSLKKEVAMESAAGEDLFRRVQARTTLSSMPRSGIISGFPQTVQSQWARSRTCREGVESVKAGPETELHPERSDKVVRQHAPAFTMGSSRRAQEPTAKRAQESERPQTSGDIPVTSARKRTIGGAFSSTPRFVERKLDYSVGINLKNEATPGTDQASVSSENTDSDQRSKRIMLSHSSALAKAYSFGKAERKTVPGLIAEANGHSAGGNSSAEIDISKADRYLRPHTMGPTMHAPKSKDQRTVLPWEENQDAAVETFVDNGVALNDYLSNRCRAPSVVMRPDISSSRRNLSAGAKTDANILNNPFPENDEFGLSEMFGYCKPKIDKAAHIESTPGPGSYDPKIKDLAGGRIYLKTQSDVKNSVDVRNNSKNPLDLDDDEFGLREILQGNDKALKGVRSDVTPGPGAYAVEAADDVVRTSAPGFSYRAPAEGKYPTKQLESKRYFEAKAKDAREGYLTSPSVELVQERSRGALILPDKKVGIDYKNRSAIMHMLNEREKIKGIGYYDTDASVIEKRVATAVAMSQEVTSRKKTEDKISSKPGVAHVKVAKEREKIANEQFLGPQLQVPWGVAPESGPHKRQKQQDDEYEDPDMNEVYGILHMKRDKYSSPSRYSEYSEAYLRSSLVGIDRGTGIIPMNRNMKTERDMGIKKLSAAELERDYLSTQVHQEWGAREGDSSAPSGANLLRLDRAPGRETKKVKRKGAIEIVDFNAPIRNFDEHGPGQYGPDDLLEFGRSVSGVAAFKDAVSRSEAVGPAGQPSEAAQERYRKVQLELEGGELDLAAETAKDGNRKEPPKAFTLYTQDRFPIERPDEEDAVLDHLGGSFFEGMNEEVESRPAVVKYDKMVGRTDKELKKKSNRGRLNDFEDYIPITGDELDLEVDEWKPHMAKTHAVKWVDLVNAPRFEKTRTGPKDEGAPDTVSPKYNQVQKKEAFMVDMSKQKGHWDEEDEGLTGGDEHMPDDLMASVARSHDAALERGRYAKSTSKRVPVAYLGRPSDDRGLLSGVKNDNEEVILDATEAIDDLGIQQGAGVLSFAKQPDRGLNPRAKRDEHKDDELNVSPHVEYKSSWKRIQGGKWGDLSSDAKRVLEENDQLDIRPDSEKFMVGSGVEKGGTAMSKQVGRDGKQTKKPSHQAAKVIDTEDSEQLDLAVVHNSKKLHSSVDWAKNDIPRRLFVSQDPDSLQNLIIEPDKARNKNVHKKSYARISNQPSRVETVYDDRDNHTELILSPKLTLTKGAMKPQLSWSKQLDTTFPNIAESQELQLSPRDEIVKQSKSKVLAWKTESPKKWSEYQQNENEELILSPSDKANRVQAAQLPSWSRGAEMLPMRDSYSEELKLETNNEINRRMSGKGAPGWEKQSAVVRHTGFSPVQGPRDADDDEVILSPTDLTSRRNVKNGSLKWSKQADSRVTEREKVIRNVEDVLQLSPSNENSRNNAGKSLVGWDKQMSRDFTENGKHKKSYVDEGSEELVLSPKDVQRLSEKHMTSWTRQSDTGTISRQIYEDGSEELKLSPKKSSIPNKDKNTLKWAKQAEDSVRGNFQKNAPDFDEEELILTSNDKFRHVAPGSKAPTWKRESDIVNVTSRNDQYYEELILSPKQTERISAGKGAALWTKLSEPGAGISEKELQQKNLDDSEELILTSKNPTEYPTRGRFSQLERTNDVMPQHFDVDYEELILSTGNRKSNKDRGKFSENERDLNVGEGKYRDADEELILSPKQPVRDFVTGGAIWTKGSDIVVDMHRYNELDEELKLSPNRPVPKGKQGEFDKSEKDPSDGVGKKKYDDSEELKLTPKDAPMFINRGRFGQSEKAINEKTVLYTDDEELKLEPKQVSRLNTAAGAGLFSRGAQCVVADYDREDEELMLSPHGADPFPKTGAIAYTENEMTTDKLLEEEELKLSPKAVQRNLGGKMAPPKAKHATFVMTNDKSIKISIRGNKSVSKNALLTGKKSDSPVVLENVSNDRKPIKSAKNGKANAPPGSVHGRAPSATADKDSKAERLKAIKSSRVQKKAARLSGPPDLLVTPPNVSVPSPHGLNPAMFGAGASRYHNAAASTKQETLSKLMNDLNI